MVPPLPISSPTTQQGLRSPTTMATASLLPPHRLSLFSYHQHRHLPFLLHLHYHRILRRGPLGFVDLINERHCLGLLFRLLFRRSRIRLFSSPPAFFSSAPPPYSIVAVRCGRRAFPLLSARRCPPSSNTTSTAHLPCSLSSSVFAIVAVVVVAVHRLPLLPLLYCGLSPLLLPTTVAASLLFLPPSSSTRVGLHRSTASFSQTSR